MLIEAWFDGCCEPVNPGGHAAWGAVVHIDGQSAYRDGGYCGHGPNMSNNVAEYSGALAAMRWVHFHLGSRFANSLVIRGDSKLVINQLSGAWNTNCTNCQKPLRYAGNGWRCGCGRPKPGLYFPFYTQAVEALANLKAKIKKVELIWIPRDKNDICDVLSKEQLHQRGVKFRIQPEPAKA